MKKDDTALFTADLNSLYPMLEWMRTHLEASGLSDVEVRRIEIALEEAFVNIIMNSFPIYLVGSLKELLKSIWLF